MKTKQEVIQEAYDNTFPDSSNYSFEKIRSAVDENGWYRFIEGLTVNICTTGFDYDKGAYRPQSLRGIENNRGWTRIESEADLPGDFGNKLYEAGYLDDQYDFHEMNKYYLGFQLKKDFERGLITHFRVKQDRKPPIY